jgi:phasin family protein
MIKSMPSPSTVRTIVIHADDGYTECCFYCIAQSQTGGTMQFVSTQHIDLMHSMSKDAVDSINRLTALNLRTARDTTQFATESFRQLLAAREPRDFFAIAHQAQDGFERFLAYGRELFTLATGLESRIRNSASDMVEATAQQAQQVQQAAQQAQQPQQPQQARPSPEVPELDELVHAAAPPPASYPGQGEHPVPDGPAHQFHSPPPRDVQVRKSARNQ